MNVAMLVTVRVALPRRPTKSGRPPDGRLVKAGPRPPGPNECLVVEPCRKEPGQPVRHASQVEIEARPVVLRNCVQAFAEFGVGCSAIRLEPVALHERNQGIGFLGAARDDSARAVIFERTPHEHPVVGQQGGRERVALETGHLGSVEPEPDGPGPPDQPSALRETS